MENIDEVQILSFRTNLPQLIKSVYSETVLITNLFGALRTDFGLTAEEVAENKKKKAVVRVFLWQKMFLDIIVVPDGGDEQQNL